MAKKVEEEREIKTLWLAVTPDKYELPIAVEESAKELAAKLGVSLSTVFMANRTNRPGTNTGRKIIKVSFK